MVTETITPTELHPDLTKEQFLEFSEIQSMTEADAREMVDWLGVRTEKFNPQTAEFLFFEMGKNQQDSAKGWGRLSVLIAARMIYHQGNPGGKETVDLEDKVRESLSGIQDNVDEILAEGFTSREGTTTWYLTERPKTCLAETVKGVVDWWWQENDSQAQLERAEFSLANERETLGQTKDLLARQREINQKAIDQIKPAEEDARALELRNSGLSEQLKYAREDVARGGTWGEPERQKAGEAWEKLTGKTQPTVMVLLEAFDSVKVAEGETEMPQGVDKANENLIKNFRQLPELWRQYLFAKAKDGKVGRDTLKAVVGKDSGLSKSQYKGLFNLFDELMKLENGNELLSHLPGVLRLQLEQRRAGQEETRKTNRQKKEVIDYFATHEIKLEKTRTRGESTIDDALLVKLNKAKEFGIKIDEQELIVPIGLEETGDLSWKLNADGSLTEMSFASQKLTATENQEDRLARLRVLALDEEKTGEFKLGIMEIKQENEVIATIELDGQAAGKVKLLWQAGNLKTVLQAGAYFVNLLSEVWGDGEEISGLKLTAVVKPGAEKPAETVAEVVASVEPAPVEEALPPAKVELPAPVVEEPAAVEEMPPPQPEEKPAETVAEELPLRAQSTL